MFLWHFKPIPLRKIFSQKILACTKDLTFGRSAHAMAKIASWLCALSEKMDRFMLLRLVFKVTRLFVGQPRLHRVCQKYAARVVTKA